GFIPGQSSFTNVNPFKRIDGQPLSRDDFLQNTTNLFFRAPAPVFAMTNRLYPTNLEFRYYLDLNRNGRFETNGLWPVINPIGTFYNANDGSFSPTPVGVLSNNFV